jgi:uncharacterized membrane protein
MKRRLLQIAVAVAGLIGVVLGLTGVLFGTMHADLSGGVLIAGLVFVPLLWLWQGHVAGVAQRSALT